MATEIKIPIPDQTTEEVRIVKWHKAVGEAVESGSVVLEVETDKSVIEIEAVGSGVLLAQLAVVDAMMPVGEVVGFVGAEGEKVDAPGKAVEQAEATAAAGCCSGASCAEASGACGCGASELPEGAVEVKVPIPDQTTEEVRVVKWHKAVGDAVAVGDVVLEVETDKSVIEIEAVGGGVLLAQGVKEDDMVPVGNVVGAIGPKGAKVTLASGAGAASAAAPAATVAPSVAPAAAAASPAGQADVKVKASPVAKKLAAKLGVDLQRVTGTGPNGRIVKDDVQRAADGVGAAAASVAAAGGAETVAAAGGAVRATMIDGRILASPNAKRLARELGVDLASVAGSGPGGRIIGSDVQQAAASGGAKATGPAAVPVVPTVPVAGQPEPGTEVPVTRMRRAIAVNLQGSSRDTPHFNATMSVNMKRAMEFRKRINDGADKGERVSVNDLVVKAVAVALKQYPAVNSRFCDTTIKYLADINIGVAIAVPDGLVVPVLTDADKRDWRDMATETKRLAGAARQGKIIGAGKGTFTISNLGMFGVEQFTGIINPPEAAILTVGATKDEVVAVDGMIAVLPMMKVTLCSDHRVIDGALAAEFLRAVKTYLEDQIS